jgi:hypothetical protein
MVNLDAFVTVKLEFASSVNYLGDTPIQISETKEEFSNA